MSPRCRWTVLGLLVVPTLSLLLACGGGSSGGTPAPTGPSITSISPTSVAAGAAGFTLTVAGTNFVQTSAVNWNGASLTTTYVSATQLTAVVPDNRLATGAAVTVTVVNPGNGGTSNGAAFAVNNPAPVMTAIAPTSVPAETGGFQLTVDGSGFSSGSQVRWNGTTLPTTYVRADQLTASVPAANLASAGFASVTVVNPSPGGGTSMAHVFSIGPAPRGSSPTHVISLGMVPTGVVWDASRGLIYAALPASAANGNSVVAINPLTGAAAAPVYVGTNPALLALSSDASHLWVGLDGANAIQRVTLPDLTPDARIDLPPSWHGPQVAVAMQAAPVNPNTLAVILGDRQITPPGIGGVAIYDGAVQRSTTIPGTPDGMTWLQWGSDDSALYGQNGSSTGFEFYALTVDASGVRMGAKHAGVFPEFWEQSHYDRATGRVYADDGRVVDPATGDVVGAFSLPNFHVYASLPDPAQPLVFFLGRDAAQDYSRSGYTLRAFDKNTYRQLGNLQIPNATGAAKNLIRWGSAGVAFNTSPVYTGDVGALYIIDGTFINASADPGFTGADTADVLPVLTAIAPESAVAGSADIVLTVSGAEFQSTATVYWNGEPLVTTYNSSSRLEAVVPASSLTQEGSATISVAYNSSFYAANSLAFTTLPASGGMIARNLSSADIVWDAHSSRLYAPVRSADPQYPNSIVAIDPATGGVSAIAAVTSDPAILRVSRDGTLGYVGFRAANLVTQFHVPALDSMMSWSLGADSFNGPYSAMDIQPAPDTARTTAVSLGATTGVSPANRGLAVYDNGIARSQRPSTFAKLYNTLQWGLTDSRLYAAENEAGGFELYTLGVDATGATLLRTDQGVLTAFYVRIHFDRGTGYLYADDGYATDPATGGHVGRFSAWGLMVPDSSLNRVFILGQTTSQSGTGDYTIFSFDQSHFTSVSSLTIRDLVGKPVAMTRWGTSGLAIVTDNSNAGPTTGPAGMLYILNDANFVR